ncbi:hypothetical protein MIMGU_mgv1a0125391mg, partial [Erythranthe guttata]
MPEALKFADNKMSEEETTINSISQLWHMNGKCPQETIPIRRTKKEDVLRATSVKRY